MTTEGWVSLTSTSARLSCCLPKSYTQVKTLCFWTGGQQGGLKKTLKWLDDWTKRRVVNGSHSTWTTKKVDDYRGLSWDLSFLTPL